MLGVGTKLPATEIAAVDPSVRSGAPVLGAFRVSDTLPAGAVMRPSTRKASTADSETDAPGSATMAEPAAIVRVAWPPNWLSLDTFSAMSTGLRCQAGSSSVVLALRASPPVATALAATVSSTRVSCCS